MHERIVLPLTFTLNNHTFLLSFSNKYSLLDGKLDKKIVEVIRKNKLNGTHFFIGRENISFSFLSMKNGAIQSVLPEEVFSDLEENYKKERDFFNQSCSDSENPGNFLETIGTLFKGFKALNSPIHTVVKDEDYMNRIFDMLADLMEFEQQDTAVDLNKFIIRVTP